nr:MAG TPA: hypothetical protein [Caudoviricetes sp.]
MLSSSNLVTLGNGIQSPRHDLDLEHIAITQSPELHKGRQRAGNISRQDGVHRRVDDGHVGPADHWISHPSIQSLGGTGAIGQTLNLGKESLVDLLVLLIQGHGMVIVTKLTAPLGIRLMEMVIGKALIELIANASKGHNFVGKSHSVILLFYSNIDLSVTDALKDVSLDSLKANVNGMSADQSKISALRRGGLSDDITASIVNRHELVSGLSVRLLASGKRRSGNLNIVHDGVQIAQGHGATSDIVKIPRIVIDIVHADTNLRGVDNPQIGGVGGRRSNGKLITAGHISVQLNSTQRNELTVVHIGLSNAASVVGIHIPASAASGVNKRMVLSHNYIISFLF